MQPDNEPDQAAPSTNQDESEAVRILSDVESGLHALKAMHEDQRSKGSQLAQREKELAERAKQLDLSAKHLAESEEKLAGERSRLDEQAAEMDALRDELTALRDQIDQQQESLDKRAREIESQSHRVDEDLKAAQQLEEQLEEKEQRLSQTTDKTAELERALQEQRERVVQAERVAAERAEELLRVHEQISTTTGETESFKSELEEAQRKESELHDQIALLQQRLVGRGALEQELAEAQQRLAQVADQPESSQADTERIRSLEADLDRAASGIERLKARYEGSLAEAANENALLKDEVASLKNNIASLQVDLQESAQERTVSPESASTTEETETQAKAHLALRRARLAAVRTVHQKRQRQIETAIGKLKERQIECERVLKQRSDVERARKELRTKRRQADQLINRNKGAKFAMYLMVAFALMLGMSWGIASQVSVATYQSSATLVAQNKDRELETYELKEWQAYHESLLDDPQFHALASERFRRRGLATLGTTTAVAELVNTRVHQRSNRPGELTIELTAVGKDRSALELSTLVTSARTFAEGARAQRTDGAATIIAQDARVADTPLNDERPMYAGGIFLGGLLLMFGIGAPVWKRLSAASSAFEEQEKANEVGAEADWVEPEMLDKKV